MQSEFSASWVYFLVLIILNSYLIINLFVAVVATSFADVRARQIQEQQRAIEALKSANISQAYSEPG